MTVKCKHRRELDAFIAEAVATAQSYAGPQLEVDDLQQAARLAVLEVERNMPQLDPAHHLRLLRRKIVDALEAEVRWFANGEADQVNLDELIEDEDGADVGPGSEERPHLIRLEWDGETSDEAATKSEVADHVREVIDGMPPDTAEVVRLCFGLDGGDAVAPIDVADILDVEPEVVLSHLWAAEKLFRHFSSEGRHRRLTPMTDLEFRAFYRVGDLAWYDLRNLNLNNADLRRCDVSHAVLTGMNLWGLKLADGRAGNANLWGAQLDGADLTGADLQAANLERASLCGVDLTRADLRSANLWGANLANTRLDHTDLSGADLRSANLCGADLTRANLSGADLRAADLRNSKLIGAELVGANVQGVELAGADFRWADLRNSDLCWSNLSVADTRGASMQGAVRSPKLTGMFAQRAPKPQRLRPVADSA